jgi:hypothetical protein
VLGHGARALAVLHLDLRDVGALDRLAERDDRHAQFRLAEQMPVQEHHSVDLAGGGEIGKAALLLGRAVQIADDHAVARREQRLLDAAQHLGEEDVAEVRQHHQHHMRLARAQRPRGRVRHIADLGDRLHHAAPRLRRHEAWAGERAADGCGRDAGEPRDLLDAGGALAASDGFCALVCCGWHQAGSCPCGLR